MNRWSATLAAAALVGAIVVAQQGGSSQTSALAADIDSHHGDAVALLERGVNINSGTQNLAGVREVGRVFRAADVSFLAGRVPMILDGVGLMGQGDHTSKATADLRTLASQAKRAAVLLSRLARAESISRGGRE